LRIRNTHSDQEFLRRLGALVAQRKIVFLGTSLIALTLDEQFNAESRFMLSPDSDPAIFSQVEGLSLRITGVAFSMAIN
jgi:hypothetical protein